jgi:YVTN family beta-propeller protein
MKQKLSFLYVLLLATVVNKVSAQPNNIHSLATFHIGGAGGWDYLSLQPNSNKLYLSHGTQVNVVDKSTGDSIAVIPNTMGVHGIAFVPDLKKGYTSNGRLNSLTVFNLETNAVLTQIPVGQNPDAIIYDSYSKRIIVCEGRSHDISVIDPATDKVVTTVDLGGKPEEAVSNGAGKIYVNIENKNEVVVIDASSFKVTGHWSLGQGEAPTGLAIDKANNRLFSGCSDNKLLVVMDATNGKVITSLPIGNDCDGVAFDAGRNVIFVPAADGTLTIIKEQSKDAFNKIGMIETKKGARTITIDTDTHKIYLPTAEFEKAPAANGRSAMIPNTFQVLVLGY